MRCIVNGDPGSRMVSAYLALLPQLAGAGYEMTGVSPEELQVALSDCQLCFSLGDCRTEPDSGLFIRSELN